MLLQGPSSAGKSTLASALQLTLDDYWLQLGADDITAMQPGCQPPVWWDPTPEERPDPSWRPEVRLERWLARYWQCLATIARTGDNVIAAGGWLKTDWMIQAAHAFDGLDALCVGVYCPLEECERREIARGDRGVWATHGPSSTSSSNTPPSTSPSTPSQCQQSKPPSTSKRPCRPSIRPSSSSECVLDML